MQSSRTKPSLVAVLPVMICWKRYASTSLRVRSCCGVALRKKPREDLYARGRSATLRNIGGEIQGTMPCNAPRPKHSACRHALGQRELVERSLQLRARLQVPHGSRQKG